MKKNLLVAFTLVSFFGHSQTTLTQSFNEPKPGDLETNFPLDTSAFTTGMPLNVTGNNAVWDFTKFKAFNVNVDSYYLSPSSVPNATNYAGCTFVQDADGAVSYYKSVTTPTEQTELLGLTMSAFNVSLTFTNTAIIVKYPVTFGSSSTDNIGGTFTLSVNGTCSGNISTTADGLGTLNLPEGYVVTNALRIKSVQTLALSAEVIPGFPTPVGSVKQTIYRYYHPSQKFPILSINYQAISLITSPTPTLTGFATGHTGYFVTGLQENKLNPADISLYPNPANADFNMSLSNATYENCKLEIYSATGQLVRSVDLGNDRTVERNISLNDLSPGIYLVKTSLGQRSATKKLVIE